jgi:hypothetical protein
LTALAFDFYAGHEVGAIVIDQVPESCAGFPMAFGQEIS